MGFGDGCEKADCPISKIEQNPMWARGIWCAKTAEHSRNLETAYGYIGQKVGSETYKIKCNIHGHKNCHKTNGVYDWAYGHHGCGGLVQGDTVKCSKPKPDVCKQVSCKAYRGIDWDPREHHRNSGTKEDHGKVRCHYDPAKFDSMYEIARFVTAHGKGSEYDKIMVNYAAKPSTKCPSSFKPLNKKDKNVCSKVRSLDDGSDQVEEWFRTTSVDNREKVASTFCRNHPNAYECGCFNRQHDKVYQGLSLGNEMSDPCWYIPCKYGGDTFIPKQLLGSECKIGQVCKQVNNYIDNKIGRDISMKDVQSKISCKYTPPPPPTRESSVQPEYDGKTDDSSTTHFDPRSVYPNSQTPQKNDIPSAEWPKIDMSDDDDESEKKKKEDDSFLSGFKLDNTQMAIAGGVVGFVVLLLIIAALRRK